MHAFTGLAALEQVTLATVAPGIAMGRAIRLMMRALVPTDRRLALRAIVTAIRSRASHPRRPIEPEIFSRVPLT